MSQITASSPARPPRPPAKGIPLFRVFGIQIRLDWSWLIIFFVMVLVLREYFGSTLRNEPEWAVWVLSAVSVVALFACVLAHELGHSLVAMRHGVQMFDITLFVFGGMARLRGEPKNPNDELKIALAGPAVTVVLAAAFWVGWYYLHPSLNLVVAEGLRYLATINTALLVFNLIPGFPLDGGRVLRAVLWKVRGNLLSATQSAANIGKGFGIVLIVLGLLMAVRGGVIGGLFDIFLGWFLMGAAAQSVQHLQIRQILEVFHVSDAMARNVVTVTPRLTLDRLTSEGFYRYHYKTFPVVDDGRFSGVISLADVQHVPPEQWPTTTVADAAGPDGAAQSIHPEEGLYEAFRRMGEEDVGRLVVVDDAGRVVGLLSRRDIMKLLQVYSELHPLNHRPQELTPSTQVVNGSAAAATESGGPAEASSSAGPPPLPPAAGSNYPPFTTEPPARGPSAVPDRQRRT